MKKFLAGVVITMAIVLIFRSCSQDKESTSVLKENTMLIQQQIANVSKLVVAEGHFAEVYNYKDSKALLGPMFTADKKALVVVNAYVTISYDISQVAFEIDEETKTLFVKSIPEAEVKINPDFEYYDVTADYLNQFSAQDYNTIKQNVNASLVKKIEASTLKTNAKNRLVSELQKFYILTNSMGWQLVYKESSISGIQDFSILP